MEFPRTADDVAPLLDTMNSLMSEMGEIRQTAAALTATATELGGRVQVTVNARGIVVETVVDEDALTTVTARDLGAAFTSATQKAAQQVAEKAQELWAPIIEKQKSLPRASNLLDGLSDITTMFGTRSEPPLHPHRHDDPDEVYVEVEETAAIDDEPHYEETSEREPRRGTITDRAW
ncbi:hypothetical protein GTV32_15145 [Gordonia sp. SID5947]|uniref:YbaB/EbfC family nucleoid-associated protein n=1 Tax=Gordonia sp. SID5947 TaxID=2690315 RepID=UPI001367B638|nr:YbaB/EbfC family nucleoid-associated protein [Gordonia sp. SID5947]MYR07556.1 hypothetical protein [Gordonia sp. SID5947]